MGWVNPKFLDLLTGQNDTRVEEGQEIPRWHRVRNARFRTGAPTRRGGEKLLAVSGTDATCWDFTSASSHYVQIPSHTVHALIPPFSFEFLFQPHSVTGTHVISGFRHATDFPWTIYTTGANVAVKWTKSGAGTVTSATTTDPLTINTTAYVRITVNVAGQTKIYVDDVLGVTTAGLVGETLIAPGGVLYFGRDNGGNYFDGYLDYFRVVKYVIPNSDMGWTRWPTPMAPYMVMDYGGEVDANDWVLDRSPFGNHGEIKNSCGTGTVLCVNPAPVQMIRGRRDGNNKTKVVIAAGGRIYDAEV